MLKFLGTGRSSTGKNGGSSRLNIGRGTSGKTSLKTPEEAHEGECISARGPKDTFDGSAKGKSPCEVDSNEGLVDGRIECRTGVHVEK